MFDLRLVVSCQVEEDVSIKKPQVRKLKAFVSFYFHVFYNFWDIVILFS